MDQPTVSPVVAPRLQQLEALLIFGLTEHYDCRNMGGIPSQWERFLPQFGRIAGQVGRVAYGVIHNSDDAGAIDYTCGVEVSGFPTQPPEFTRLRIPPQTYAVFEHREHISFIQGTWSHIWNRGLSSAGYQATDGPAFERYGEEFDGRTGLGGLELWVPVKA